MSLTKVSYSMVNGAPANVLDFGAVADGVTDDWAAIMAAVNSGAKRIYFPAGTYYVSKCIKLLQKTMLEGVNGFDSGKSDSILKFSDSTVGIIVHSRNTNSDDYGLNNYIESPPRTVGADGSIIKYLAIQRGDGTAVTPTGLLHGVRMRARAYVENCYIQGFAGSGIYIYADGTTATPDFFGNANNFGVANTYVRYCQDGIYVDGPDTNVGYILHGNFTSNQRYGIFESSALGGTYVDCHCASNTTYDIKHEGSGNRSTFIGQYVETGGLIDAVYPGMFFSGQLTGLTITGDALFFRSSSSTFPSFTTKLQTSTDICEIQNPGAATTASRSFGVWNQGAYSSTRNAGMYLKVGTTATNNPVGAFVGRGGTSAITGRSAVSLEIYDGTAVAYETAIEARGSVNDIIPGTDNTWDLGDASFRYKEIFAANGTINTSDEREKQDIENLSEAEKRVAVAIKGLVKKFRFKDAVAKKGDNARIHIGVVAQEVVAAFQSEGLDPNHYGIVCYDEWEANEEHGTLAGNRYGIRYEQLLAFVLAAI